MRSKLVVLLSALVFVFFAGCGSSGSDGGGASASTGEDGGGEKTKVEIIAQISCKPSLPVSWCDIKFFSPMDEDMNALYNYDDFGFCTMGMQGVTTGEFDFIDYHNYFKFNVYTNKGEEEGFYGKGGTLEMIFNNVSKGNNILLGDPLSEEEKELVFGGVTFEYVYNIDNVWIKCKTLGTRKVDIDFKTQVLYHMWK